MKLLLFANTDWYLYNFRRGLAMSARKAGHEVVLACPTGKYVGGLEELGFRVILVNMDRASMGLMSNLSLVRRFAGVLSEVNPDLLHNFTPKCVLSGGIAARIRGIPCVNAITGLGHLFIHHDLKTRLARMVATPIFRFACRGPKCHVVFQNEEDRGLFLKDGLAEETRTSLIRGSGADCERFSPSKPGSDEVAHSCRILFASRLLREKGIYELLEAAKELREGGMDFELVIAGDPYPGNPSSMTNKEVEQIHSSGIARFVGHHDDILPLLMEADLVVLPSWREGTPKILLEAGACGLPLVATDIAGCRGVVQPGVNGELVPVKNPEILAKALQRLISERLLRERYGRASRRIIEGEFSEERVVQRTLQVYQEMKRPSK